MARARAHTHAYPPTHTHRQTDSRHTQRERDGIILIYKPQWNRLTGDTVSL